MAAYEPERYQRSVKILFSFTQVIFHKLEIFALTNNTMCRKLLKVTKYLFKFNKLIKKTFLCIKTLESTCFMKV